MSTTQISGLPTAESITDETQFATDDASNVTQKVTGAQLKNYAVNDFSFPEEDGSSGQLLATDGGKQLYWETGGGGGMVVGYSSTSSNTNQFTNLIYRGDYADGLEILSLNYTPQKIGNKLLIEFSGSISNSATFDPGDMPLDPSLAVVGIHINTDNALSTTRIGAQSYDSPNTIDRNRGNGSGYVFTEYTTTSLSELTLSVRLGTLYGFSNAFTLSGANGRRYLRVTELEV